MFNMDYNKMCKYFDDNAGLLSMNKINEFFAKIPAEDRMEVETFMRTELGLNVFDYITVIPKGMFAFNSDLSTITIPSTIIEIEDEAFRGCAATQIEIQAPISVINTRTFENCTKLRTVSLPEGIAVLGDEAFKDCTALEELSLPDSLSEIGKNVFVGCPRTLEISISRNTLPNIRFKRQNEAEALKSHLKIR